MLAKSIALLLGTFFIVIVFCGCDADTGSPSTDMRAIPKPDPTETKARPAAPVPKTLEDVAKLGIPVFPGAVIADEPNSATLDEKTYSRIYKVKMYAPQVANAVIPVYVKGIPDSSLTGGSDAHKVIGKTANGDDIEVFLGPAADHSKTLVMVWLTQKK